MIPGQLSNNETESFYQIEDNMEKADQLRRKIRKLTEELYTCYHQEYDLLFGNVLVYMLPREQRIGQIWVPDNEKSQNKVTLEGIVLKTWNSPKWITTKTDFKDGSSLEVDSIRVETQLSVGDHILFSHYAGQPVSKETDKDFRIIKEYSFNGRDLSVGDIFAKITYDGVGLQKFKQQVWEDIVFVIDEENEIDELFNKYVIHPKASRTLSGK